MSIYKKKSRFLVSKKENLFGLKDPDATMNLKRRTKEKIRSKKTFNKTSIKKIVYIPKLNEIMTAFLSLVGQHHFVVAMDFIIILNRAAYQAICGYNVLRPGIAIDNPHKIFAGILKLCGLDGKIWLKEEPLNDIISKFYGITSGIRYTIGYTT